MPPKPDSSQFAAELHELFERRAKTNKKLHMPKKAAIAELADQTAYLVTLYLGAPARLRPSTTARRLTTMAKALTRAADSAEAMGSQGMTHIVAASGADRDATDVEPERHIAYLRTLATWTERAAKTAGELSVQAGDNRPGRSPDETLRRLVSQLHDRYAETLSMTPTHTVDRDSGVGVSPFDLYVKEALRHFAPEGTYFESRHVDDAILYAARIRKDLEPFAPPTII